MPHSIMYLMAWSRQRRHTHSKWPNRETNNTNSLLWGKDYLLWWQTTIFFSCASVGPLNKQMVLLSRRFNQSWDPRTVTIWMRQFLWYVSGLIFLPMFFPFLLSKAPLDPIETLISKVADYLMYWKNSSVENWLEKTTTTPNYATWNTNELFSVHALANAMSRFRLEFGVNKHL